MKSSDLQIVNKDLHLGVTNEDLTRIESALKNGADINLKDEYGYTVLHTACLMEYSIEVIETLLKNGSDVNAKNKYGSTSLDIAVKKEYLESIKLLVTYGADPSQARDLFELYPEYSGYNSTFLITINMNIEDIKNNNFFS